MRFYSHEFRDSGIDDSDIAVKCQSCVWTQVEPLEPTRSADHQAREQ